MFQGRGKHLLPFIAAKVRLLMDFMSALSNQRSISTQPFETAGNAIMSVQWRTTMALRVVDHLTLPA